MKSIYITITLILSTVISSAQTTSIPDQNFEKALIQQGIDTDGMVNGRVATDDIDHIKILKITQRGGVSNMKGIEDFSSLVELHAGNHQAGSNGNTFREIDLSNNKKLEAVFLDNNWYLRKVNLKNGNNSKLKSFSAICQLDFDNCDHPLCIEVDNSQMANKREGAYANFRLVQSAAFSKSCSLGINENRNLNFKIYPNPVGERLNVEIDQEIKSLQVFDLSGKMVKQFKENKKSFSLSSLGSGVYFLKLKTPNKTGLKRIIKK